MTSAESVPHAAFERLKTAQMPRDEYGHNGIMWNQETGRFDCPVLKHTPTRIVDVADATLIWETDDADDEFTAPVPGEQLVTDGGQSLEEQKEAHRLGTINRWDAPEADWAADYDWTRYRGPQPYPVPKDWVLDEPEGGIVGWQHFPDVGKGHGLLDDVYDELEGDYDDWDAYEAAVEEARGVRAYLSNDIVEDGRDMDVILEHELSIAGDTVFRRVDPSDDELWARTSEALARYADGESVEEFADDIGFQSGRLPDDLQEERENERRREENAGLDEFATDGGQPAEDGQGDPQSFGDVPLNVVEDAVFEIRQRADFIGWTDYEREQQYHALADHLLDLKREWPVGRGAVLYGPDGDEKSRDLWHVTDRLASVDGSTKIVTLWDGTHTSRRYVRAEDLLADYTPAGWSWPTGKKPLYHLTRQCGADDRGDLMTDGGRRHDTDHVDGKLLVECPEDADHLSVTVEVTNFEQKPSELFWLDECRVCGAELAHVEETQPTEVLE